MLPLPLWPTFNPDRPQQFFINAANLYNAWLGIGVPVPFAVAMVTQAEFESAFRPDVIGDNGTAHNLYQWHWNPRGLTILSETGIDVRTERAASRIVAAAWWESNNTEKRARDAILAATTAADASRAACTLFEGAGAPAAAERRAAGANRWSAFIADHADFIAAHKAP